MNADARMTIAVAKAKRRRRMRAEFLQVSGSSHNTPEAASEDRNGRSGDFTEDMRCELSYATGDYLG